jgi:hypothetical protein
MISTDQIYSCLIGLSKDLTPVYVFKESMLDRRVAAGYSRQGDIDTTSHAGVVKDWCRENIGEEGKQWVWHGVTVYSYKVLFANKEDATAFKLRFGL